jgi:hypothetical protein
MNTASNNEDEMFFGINENFKQRATEHARRMISDGKKRMTIPLHENGDPHEIGIIADSEQDMILLGQIEIDGRTFYLGLPKEGQ